MQAIFGGYTIYNFHWVQGYLVQRGNDTFICGPITKVNDDKIELAWYYMVHSTSVELICLEETNFSFLGDERIFGLPEGV